MDNNDFKRGDPIYIASWDISKSEFIWGTNEHFSCQHSIEGPNYWWQPIGKTRNEAIDALIKQLEESKD